MISGFSPRRAAFEYRRIAGDTELKLVVRSEVVSSKPRCVEYAGVVEA